MEGGGRSVERERRISLEWVFPLLFLFRTHYLLWKAPTVYCRPTCGTHSKRCHVSSGCFLTILSRRRHPMVACRILLSYVIPLSHSKKPRYNIRSSDEYLYDVDAATLVFSPISTCLYRAGYHAVDSPLTLGSRTRAAYSSGVMLQNEREKHFDMPVSECERDFSEAATYETACIYGRLFTNLSPCAARLVVVPVSPVAVPVPVPVSPVAVSPPAVPGAGTRGRGRSGAGTLSGGAAQAGVEAAGVLLIYRRGERSVEPYCCQIQIARPSDFSLSRHL